jgi:uncharacterized membrane protein YphA (DoxX/SURF4 family)
MKRKISYISAALFALFPSISFAHVTYVLPPEDVQAGKGIDFAYLLSPLKDSGNLILIASAILLVWGIFIWYRKSEYLQKRVFFINQKASTYHGLLPWILRLSTGIALIGAGASGHLISPVSDIASFSTLQILLGFLMLLGFLLPLVIWFSIFLFFFVLSKTFLIIGNLEFLAALLSLLTLASPRPGLDDLIGRHFISPFKRLKWLVPIFLRVGVGASMVFLALYEKILNPHMAATVVNAYDLTSIVPVSPEMWVFSAGMIELLVGLALLVGYQAQLASIIAFLVLSLSFFFFKEEVYAHITLFGALSAIFISESSVYNRKAPPPAD